MPRTIISPPDFSGAALAALKEWLAITTVREDALLVRLLASAHETCERFTGLMPLGCGVEAWATHERALATWAETLWLFAEPREGANVHDAASGALAAFTAAQASQRASVPAAPSGGTTQDTEVRAALSELVTKLHALRIFSA